MEKHFLIPIDIYNKDVFVYIGSVTGLFDELGKLKLSDCQKTTIKEEISAVDGNGYTIVLDNGATIIWVDEMIDDVNEMFRVLIHEIYHAVQGIYRSIGVYPNSSNEECYAYLQEYLFSQIVNHLGLQVCLKH